MNKSLCLCAFYLIIFSLSYVKIVAQGNEKSLMDINIVSQTGYIGLKSSSDAISVGGKVFDSYVSLSTSNYIGNSGNSLTFDIRGWNKFISAIGMKDEDQGKTNIKFYVDGDELVLDKNIQSNSKIENIAIDLTGKETMKIVVNDRREDIVLIHPVLIKGNPQISCQFCDKKFNSLIERDQHTKTAHPKGDNFLCPNCGQVFISAEARDQHVKTIHGDWPYAVDPKDLETLAIALRKRVDAKPELKTKIENAQVALMTFNLIDIPKSSVAEKVAENLSTSLINNDFPLVERGQLDKAFKELKLQATGVIDPATAKKLGEITGCNIILVGSISDEGQFVVINARFLDTSTGKALAAERVEMRKIEIKK